MSDISVYCDLMGQTQNMALANPTAYGCNVRIVSYFLNEDTPSVLYFTTFRDCAKNAEFAADNRVSFTSIPAEGVIQHVRSTDATVKRSAKKLEDILDMILKRMPDHVAASPEMRNALELYEIHLKSARLILGYDKNLNVVF